MYQLCLIQVQPRDQYKRTADGQPLMSSNGSFIKPFTVALETLMLIAVCWRCSEKSTGLRRIRLKLYCLEVSLGSPAQGPVLCSAYAVRESRLFYVYSLGMGWDAETKKKVSSKFVNCAIISWNAVLCFPRVSIYKAHGSRDSQQV